MRKILVAAAFLAAASVIGFAQAASVAIQNEEESTFYYTVDPPELAQVSPGSPSAATKVAEFFASQSSSPEFTALAPGAQVSLAGLSNGAHLLVGFFAMEDRDAFPVRLITIQADSSMGERFYAIYGSPAIMDASRGVGRLSQFAPGQQTVASAPEAASPAETAPAAEVPPAAAVPEATPPAAPAAQAAPAATAAAPAEPAPAPAAPSVTPPGELLSFSAGYNPVLFTRESQAGFSVQPIADSRAWRTPATHITGLKARIDEGTLTLSLTTADGFSQDVSYFFYAFPDRSPGTTASFTLELKPRALPDRGACLLWLPAQGSSSGGSGKPSLLGSVTVDGNTATLVADLKDAPPEVLQSLSAAASFDLTSCSFDKASGTYEEFYFATVAAQDIASTR